MQTLVLDQSNPIVDSLVFANLGPRIEPGSAYYHDWSLRHNHGTLTPTAATGPQWAWNHYLQRWGMAFDGTNDAISLPAAMNRLPGTFTFSAWMTPTAVSGGNNQWVFLSDWTGDHKNIIAYISSSAISVVFGDGGSNQGSTITSSAFLSAGKLTHVCILRVGTAASIYGNGVLVGSGDATYGGGATTNTRNLGANTDVNSGWIYKGLLADPLIANAALSPAQIAWHANPTNHLLVPRRRVYAAVTAGAPAGFKPYWASRCNTLIGAGI